MDVPKYSELEFERRFLVPKDLCPNLADRDFRLITDCYIAESRLRLRSIIPSNGDAPEFKFCKKYESASAIAGPIVNIYLTGEEYLTLSALPGKQIRKRRYCMNYGANDFALDVFLDELDGLVLCEAEGKSNSAVSAIIFPPWARNEVTADQFFTGGNLCAVSAIELKSRLSCL